MRKSVIETGILASSLLYSNTVSANIRNKQYNTPGYQWTVETESDIYTGTCLTMNEVNEEITRLTKGKKVLKKNVTPIPPLDDLVYTTDKIYTWNVVTKFGCASGVSTNLKETERVVKSFGSTDIIKSAIIESKY